VTTDLAVEPGDRADDLLPDKRIETIEEFQALSHPLRASIRFLLVEQERTVKELAELLKVPVRRLYYHVTELERVGLIRVTRSEVAGGPAQRYYRAVAHSLTVPFDLLHGDAGLELSSTAARYEIKRMESLLALLRHALTHPDEVQQLDPEIYYFQRGYIRVRPERARELAKRMRALFEECDEYDEGDADGMIRLTMATLLIPHETVFFVPDEEKGTVEQDDASPPS
jgi:DNA-binding transcriptional ArsR family regulator